MHIAICDDDFIVCSQVKGFLKALSVNRNIKMSMTVFNTGEKFYKSIESGLKYDIVFLDIELGDLMGTTIACNVRNHLKDPFTKIIFISSSNDYGPEVVDSSPIKYLIKPLNYDMIEDAYLVAKKSIDEDRKEFIYKEGKSKKSVPLKSILYFEAFDKKVRIVTTKGDVFFYGKISEIVKQDITGFIFTHRSYVINYFYLKDYAANEVVMKNNDKLPISIARRDQVEDIMMKYYERYATSSQI